MGADVNVFKLKQYIHELAEYTNQIQRRKMVLEKDFAEIRTAWDDVVFQDYLNQYKTISSEIDVFISRSKKIQDGLNAKLVPLMRYLNG